MCGVHRVGLCRPDLYPVVEKRDHVHGFRFEDEQLGAGRHVLHQQHQPKLIIIRFGNDPVP